MANSHSDVSAFILGYRVGRKTRRFWSAREASEAYPGTDVDVFLSGADDGARGDSWRYDQLQREQTAAA